MREKEKGGNGKDRKRKGGVEKRKLKKKKRKPEKKKTNLRGWGVVFMARRKRQRNWKTGERETSKGDGEKEARKKDTRGRKEQGAEEHDPRWAHLC